MITTVVAVVVAGIVTGIVVNDIAIVIFLDFWTILWKLSIPNNIFASPHKKSMHNLIGHITHLRV
mgnify:CR=1 FL=1